MTPLSFFETEGFDIEQIMISGLLPSHFLSKYPKEELRAYLADYLKEEIANEAAVRSISTFSDFLKIAALTSGELINYANIGRECGVSPKVVRDYVDILEDTYLGFRISPWKKSRNRRLIETEKFYLFDVGVSNFLSRREPKLGTPEFGKSFEHYILMELKAYQAYRDQELEIRYWRTSTGQEVDFILGEKDLAIEIKASSRTHETDTRSLEALKDDGNIKKAVLISFESQRKILNGWIEVLPWKDFLQKLWNGDFV
jgi:predicted AAA+ superfamily ATPase